MLSADLLVVPALAVLLARSLAAQPRLTKLDIAMLGFAAYYFFIRAQQGGWSPYNIGVGAKHFLWLTAWIPARSFLRNERRVDAFAGAMVVSLLVISVLTVQEYFSGSNYFEWAFPGLQDTRPIVRFGVVRFAGAFGHGVTTGILITVLLPFCFAWRHRIISLAAGALGLVALFMGQGRSAWLSLIVSVAIALSLAYRAGVLTRRTVGLGLTLALPILALTYREIGFVVSVLRGSFSDQPVIIAGDVGFDFGARAGDAALSVATLGGSFQRTEFWGPLLSQLGHVPLFGYGAEVVAKSFQSLAGVLVNEWPAALEGWFAYGPAQGILMETCLLGGMFILARACLRPSAVSPRYRLAAFVGFASQAIALHANYVGWTWSVPLSFMFVGFVEVARQPKVTAGAA